MKINFYGATEEAACKKGNTFIKSLKKAEKKLKEKENMVINITKINKSLAWDGNCIVNAYRYCVCCEYNIMSIESKG